MLIEIMLLDAANVDLLKNIAPEVFDHDINPRYLKAFISDPRHIMSLAVDNKIIVDMASAIEYFHPDKPPQLWINEVGVALNYRNRGISKQLVQALVVVAKERGCAYAWLGTNTDNVAAQACFSSVPGGNIPQPFLLYEWELE